MRSQTNMFRRQSDFSDRIYAESLLGNKYPVRTYARHGNVSRGTVMLDGESGYTVQTAYIISSNDKIGVSFTGVCIGVLVDKQGCVGVVLDESDTPYNWTQHEIAEALEHWDETENAKIYCLYEKSCGAVVFTGEGKDRKYLIIKMNLGHCGLPKGHMEKHETEHQTAFREVLEETGVEITFIDGFRHTVEYVLTSKTKKQSVYFLGRFDGEGVKIQESEVSSYKLCHYDQVKKLITYENDRAIVDAAEKLLNELEAK